MNEKDIKDLFALVLDLEQQIKILNKELRRGFNPNQLMTAQDIATEYSIDKKVVSQIFNSGSIQARQQGTKVTKVRRADFDAYLNRVYSNDFRNDAIFTKPVPR